MSLKPSIRRALSTSGSIDGKPQLTEKELMRQNIMLELASTHYTLLPAEKQFLLHAERGDCASVERIIETYKDRPREFNINCLDPLNRSALIAAIEKENIDLIKLLLNAGIQVKDALLHAIDEEYVEGVEVLLNWEEETHVAGEPYSWESVDKASSTFTPDISPVILAAHKNNYEILKLLMDRGATLPIVHDIRCGCDDCVESSEKDSLRHSQARINAYKALSSPSLIGLSSRDPLLTAFQLYWELKRLSQVETEFRLEYNEMRDTVQTFVSTLLNHVRTSQELEIVMNYNSTGTPWEPGEQPTLDRLKLAIKYKLKMFVAHPNVQQLLASMWYQGLPGFRRKSMVQQGIQVCTMAAMFFIYSTMYMLNPESKLGCYLKFPFVKFICHSASYGFFLSLLALASQRVEVLFLKHVGNEWMENLANEMIRKERGSVPGFIESLIMIYVISLIWNEIKSLYEDGLVEYLADLWNIVDFISFSNYVVWIYLRFTAIIIVQRELAQGYDPWYARDQWTNFDPHMVSEGAFAAAMIISFLKLVHIFSVNPHLGPLQISLGRMIIDIVKFFFIYTLVLFAFGCGMTSLLWFFAGVEEDKCYPHGTDVPDFTNQDKACTIWRRFVNLFEASQSLFWASFGLVDLTAFDMTGIKSFTRFWALLIFGCYSVMNIIVLLNMLIAMMSNSYQIISERSDMEWKFARSKLFISYFETGNTVAPPLNLLPSMKNVNQIIGKRKAQRSASFKKKQETNREKADLRYDIVMQMLIRRYVTSEQKKMDEFGVTEDDVAEVRHDVSTFRYELLDILRKNGYTVPKAATDDDGGAVLGKRDRIMERRLKKDFQIGMVESMLKEAVTTDKSNESIFGKLANVIKRVDSKTKKKNWNSIVQNSVKKIDPIGSGSETAIRIRKQNIRRHILEHQGTHLLDMDPEKLLEYNPNLESFNPTARIAYAKFKINLIKREYKKIEGDIVSDKNENSEKMSSLTETPSTSSTSAVVTVIDERKPDEEKLKIEEPSIIRPRPQSSKKKVSTVGKLPSLLEKPDSESNKTEQDIKEEIAEEGSDEIEIDEKASSNEEIESKTVEEHDKEIVEKCDEKHENEESELKENPSTSTTQPKNQISEQISKPKHSSKESDTTEEIPKIETHHTEHDSKLVIYEYKGESHYPPGKGKSKVSGSVVTGWV